MSARPMACALGTVAWLALAGAAAAQPVEGYGVVRGVVFGPQGDRPLAGVLLWHDPLLPVATNADGAFVLTLEPGARVLKWSAPGLGLGRTPPIPVHAGATAEVVISLQPDGSAEQVALEAASRPVAAGATAAPDAARAALAGRLVHIEKRSPVAGARIFVRGQTEQARSDADGRFALQLPAGAHLLTVVHPDFATHSLPAVELVADETTALTIELTPVAVQLDDFVVSVPKVDGAVFALLDERRDSAAVSDVIGAEQMSKSGDSDAAGALKRVTGVTVMGGRYVYVRGLGERYSATLLNGSSLPSPEPERRVVPLDMFPVALLDAVVIQKTYTPDMPAEFGGGVVQLRTRDFPEQFRASVSISGGARLGTTFERGLKSAGGSLDWLGIDDGSRALPGPVRKASNDSPLLERDMFSDRGYTAEQLEAFGEMMPNRWSPRRGRLWPDLGLTATVGDGFEIAGMPAGAMASLTYDNEWKMLDRHVNFTTLSSGGLELSHQYDFRETENTITLAGVLALGIELAENHRLRATTLVDRISDDIARIYQGFNRDVGDDIRVTRLRWLERMLIAQQLHGQHAWESLGGLGLDWRYNFAVASRLEPDRREVRYDHEAGDVWLLSDRPEGNQRLFSELTDTNHDLGLDFSWPFAQWSGLAAELKAGLQAVIKDRQVDTRRYKYAHKGPSAGDPEVISQPPEAIFTPQHIGADGFQFTEITRQTDNYSGEMRIYAGYAMCELPLLAGLRLVGGLRVEHADQQVRTFELFNPDQQPVRSGKPFTDVLPSLGLNWELAEDMLLRAGVSRTVSRPDFRELSPATFNDVTGGRQIFGNPDLQRAVLTNADVRWEWYPSRTESISVALFYKHFDRPIETIVIASAQHSVTWENSSAAHNAGVEVEFRKHLGFVHPALEDLSLAGNAAYIYSRVELPEDGIQTSKERPLQGQSPFVFNIQLTYDNVDWGTTLSLLYNVFGERIVEAGAQGTPDVYEQPFHQLDFVYRQALGDGWRLSAKFKNMLDWKKTYQQGPITTESYRRGRALSLGLGKSF